MLKQELHKESLFSRTLGESRLDVIKESMDVSLVLKPMSFEMDVPALEGRVDYYIESWKKQIERDVEF